MTDKATQELWPEPRQTNNAILLEGYLCGALMNPADPLYRVIEWTGEYGGTVIEHKRTGNRYLMKVAQISGSE
jgi:hypothetical protein